MDWRNSVLKLSEKMFLMNLEDFSKGFLITLLRKPYQRPQKITEILENIFSLNFRTEFLHDKKVFFIQIFISNQVSAYAV